MGLTIHYSLHCDTQSPNKVRELLARLRQHALDLPLKEVGDLVEFTGDECDFENRDQDDPHRWLLVQAGSYFERDRFQFHVPPKHLFAFSGYPPRSAPAMYQLLLRKTELPPSVIALSKAVPSPYANTPAPHHNK